MTLMTLNTIDLFTGARARAYMRRYVCNSVISVIVSLINKQQYKESNKGNRLIVVTGTNVPVKLVRPFNGL